MMGEKLPPFTIAILAGGKSTRMGGGDKLAMPVAGKPLLLRVIERLAPLSAEADALFLVAKNRERFKKFAVPVVLDSRRTGGALVGIAAALANAKSDYVLAVGGDMPFVSPEIGKMLLSRCSGRDVTIPMRGGLYEALFAVYARSCLPVFEAGLDRGIKKIIELFESLSILKVPQSDWGPLDAREAAFMNINTSEDLARANSLLAQ